MSSTIRQHGGALLVAAGVVAASLLEGAFGATAYAAFSIVIWAAVIAGVLSRVLPTKTPAGTAAIAGICLAAGGVLAGASVAWASDQGRAFEEAVRVLTYLGLFTLASCSATRGARAQWLGGLAAGLGAVSVLAVLSRLQPGLLDGGELAGLIPTASGRLSYPIGYWNGLGALLAGAAVLLAHGGVAAGDGRLRAVSTAILPVALLGIWLTTSRGGAAAAVIGLLVLLVASEDRARQLVVVAIGAASGAVLILAAEAMGSLTSGAADAAARADGDRMTAVVVVVVALSAIAARALDGVRPRVHLSRRVVVGLAALASLAVLVALVVADPAERFDEFKQPPTTRSVFGEAPPVTDDLNSSGRWQFWTEAVDALESAPLAGIGAGGYEDWWAQHAPITLYVRNPHSLPLQQGAELGLLGLVLLGGFLAALGVAGWRRLARGGRSGDVGALLAVLAAAGVGALGDWTWAIPAVFAPALIAAGLLTASAPGRPPGRNVYWLGLGTVAIGWVAVICSALVLLTELKLEQSRDAAREGRIDDGVERALEARTVQPWSSEPYTQLALLEEARGDFDQALVRLHQAQERDSEDWRLALIEARLQRGRGDAAAARAADERSQDLFPLRLFIQGQG